MSFEDKLHDDLTEMLHRLENPTPTSVKDLNGGVERYQKDGMFHAKVKNLVAGTMQTVMKSLNTRAPQAASDSVTIERLEGEVQALTDLYETASEEQDRLLIIEKQLEQDKAKLMELIKDYALISIDNKRLVRELEKDLATAIWHHPQWGATTLPPSTWDEIKKNQIALKDRLAEHTQ
jgi:hypothetical protein